MWSPPLDCSWVNAAWVGRAPALIPELSSLWQRIWNKEGRHDDRFVPCVPKERSINLIPESPWTPRWSGTVVASSGHRCRVHLRPKRPRAAPSCDPLASPPQTCMSTQQHKPMQKLLLPGLKYNTAMQGLWNFSPSKQKEKSTWNSIWIIRTKINYAFH